MVVKVPRVPAAWLAVRKATKLAPFFLLIRVKAGVARVTKLIGELLGRRFPQEVNWIGLIIRVHLALHVE